MSIVIGKSAVMSVKDGDRYVTLIVATFPHGTRYFAIESNGRVIQLNGYSFENEFKQLCSALGVECTY